MLATKTNRQRIARYLLGTSLYGRAVRVGFVLILVVSILIPLVQEIIAHRKYTLNAATIKLVGDTNPNLTKKFTFDSEHAQWQFNEGQIRNTNDNPVEALRAQVGGGGERDESLYSVDLPEDGKKGITYFDNDTQLSFTMVPNFKVGTGSLRDGRLIYPSANGSKLVYTAKNNGMKEDIILPKFVSDNVVFSYKLNLPETLQAKLHEDGSVGVYSADPALFGSISFGTDTDREKVESARKTAAKDHLLFALPAPIVNQSGANNKPIHSEFILEGDTLKLYANGLKNLHYPISVDPSVIITSSSDFSKGNDEGNISFGTNQLNRGNLTGATVGSWSSTSALNAGRDGSDSVAYNGYLYVIGGITSGGIYLDTAEYAPINSDGTVGTWAYTSTFPYEMARHDVVAYNGYIYLIGGADNGMQMDFAYYAPLNSDGTIGTWVDTTSFTTARYSADAVAYNGYMYISGGTNGTSMNNVQYAPINADGTLGSWTNTTSFTTARDSHEMLVYNNYAYIIGGWNGTTRYADVQYAPINADGTIGTWVATTSFTTARSGHSSVIHNGYMYVLGGFTTAAQAGVQYASVNANGTVGAWATTTSFTTARSNHNTVEYNGYLYVIAGYAGGYSTTVQKTLVDTAGVTGDYAATTALATARRSPVSVAYNGYLYAIGGNTNETTGQLTTVSYATINAAGTIGSWANTTAFTTKRAYFYAAAYNGYMYVVGGRTATSTVTNTVYYSAIASNGTVGSWTATTSFTNGRQQFGGAIHNGYMYIAGGDSAAGTQYNDVQYAAINAAGTLGTWASTTSFTNVREGLAAVASGGYLYVLGGWGATGGAGTYYDDVQYAPINANGTVGTWATTTSFTTTRQGHNVTIANGFMYIAGGSNASYHGDVQYAPVNANGTVGTWATTTSLMSPGARANFGMVYYRGFMYIVGGFDSGSNYLTNVQYASVNNGGSGTVGTWTVDSGNVFVGSSTRILHQTLAYNGYLYVIGGKMGTTFYNTVMYAPINANGSLGSWTNDARTFTTARSTFAATIYNGYLYVAGGLDSGSTRLDDVQYAPIGSSGALTANFATTNVFAPSARSGGCATAYNGYLYMSGGRDGSDYATTRYAAINSDGSVGTWADSGNNFTNARSNHQCFVNNGYIYILGGEGAAVYNDVQYAPINGNGTLGTWKQTNSFNGKRYYFASGLSNGYIYIMGGTSTGSDQLGDVQYASINANGSIAAWQHSTSVAAALQALGGAVSNGYLYITGGSESGGDKQYAQYAPLNAISRKGRYSKLMDFGGQYALSTIAYNGSLPGGLSYISVKQAGYSAVFGSSSLASSLTSLAVCTAGTTRYVLMTVTLDDTQMAAFPDSLQYANATDVTVNYVVKHPDPSIRLRGGKYFVQEQLQPLDTCGS